jgi:hypothetical protein
MGLSAEVHIAKLELADQGRRRLRWCPLFLFVSFQDLVNSPIELPNAQSAEMEVWGEKGGCLRREGSWSCIRLLKGSSVLLVFKDSVEGLQSCSFAASMRGAGFSNPKLGKGLDGKMVLRASNRGVWTLFRRTILDIEIRIGWRRFMINGWQIRIPGSGSDMGAGIGRAGSLSFFPAYTMQYEWASQKLQMIPLQDTYILHPEMLIVGFPPLCLTSASGSHSVLPSFVITSTPASFTSFIYQLHHLCVSIPSVSICILLKHQVWNVPRFEELWEEVWGASRIRNSLDFFVQLGDGGWEIVFAVNAAIMG